MKKITIFLILFSLSSSLFAKSEYTPQKSDIDDIHNLTIVYQSFIIKEQNEKTRRKMVNLLNNLDYNNKDKVILAISYLENLVQK